MSDSANSLIKAATNEWALLAYRFTTGGCALLMTWWVFDLKTETHDMRRDFTQSRLETEARISKAEGQLSVFDNAIRMQSKTIETHETALQSLWNRIYELRNPPRATP